MKTRIPRPLIPAAAGLAVLAFALPAHAQRGQGRHHRPAHVEVVVHHGADTSQRASAEAELARLDRAYSRLAQRASAYSDATINQWLGLAADALADAERILDYGFSVAAYDTYVMQAETRMSTVESRMDTLDAQVLVEGRHAAARVASHAASLGHHAPRRAHDLIDEAEDALDAGDRAARSGRPDEARAWYARAESTASDASRIASSWHAEQSRIARLERQYDRDLAAVESTLATARAGFTRQSPIEAERQADAALERIESAEYRRARGDLDGAIAELARAHAHADEAVAQVSRTHRGYGTSAVPARYNDTPSRGHHRGHDRWDDDDHWDDDWDDDRRGGDCDSHGRRGRHSI